MPDVYKCSNSKDGCKFNVRQKPLSLQLQKHENQCSYRKGNTAKKKETKDRRNDFECINAEEGCDFKIEHSTLFGHEQECDYRRVHCPDGLCEQLVRFCDLRRHIKDAHRDADWEEEPGESALRNWFISKAQHFGSKSNNWVLNLWEHDESTFVARFRKLGGFWYTWVYVLGDISEASEYRCLIATGNDDLDSKLSYEGPVHCIDELETEICKSADCLIFTDAMIELFLEKVNKVELFSDGYDGRLPLDYTIKKDQ